MRCDGIVETGLVSGSHYIAVGSAWCRTNDDIDSIPYKKHNSCYAKLGGGNNNNCGLKELENFEIAKAPILVITYLYCIC